MCANPSRQLQASVTLSAEATATAPALRLRPWQPQDTAALANAHRDALLRRMLMTAVTGEAAARQWIDDQAEAWVNGTRYCFAVLEGEAGPARLLGNVVVKMASDFSATAAEVGYWTAAVARGRGIAPRAVDVVSQWTFSSWEAVERLELLHAVDNPATCRVADKCGFRLESELPPRPPTYPGSGHLHVKTRDDHRAGQP